MEGKDSKRFFGIILSIFSVLCIAGGYIYLYGFNFSLCSLVNDFYANIGSELASIAITILIIDYLGERRANRMLMLQLTREMGLKDNAFATKAVRELRAHGWLKDGSLQGVDLGASDLSGSDLSDANLAHAILTAANLNRTFLRNAKLNNAKINGVNMEDADLSNSDLTGADISWSDLSKADLTDARLSSAKMVGVALGGSKVTTDQLRQAKSLEQAIMPDGRKYEEWVASNDI